MKYLEVKFCITDNQGRNIDDEMLLQAAKDILCDFAGNAGFESFEDVMSTVTGYVQTQNFNKEVLDECLNNFPIDDIQITYNVEDAEDKNWNAAWEEQGFKPILIENKCIIHDKNNVPQLVEDENMLNITIDTEQAFGTGNHETTYMIINELFNTELKDKLFLDCGCGTGILSIVASKLGSKAVTAYDIDEWSVRNTTHNCTLNNVENVSVLLGDSNVLKDIKDKYDVITANINRNILLADMHMFKQKMSAGAVLILSGFYTSDTEILVEKAKSLKLTLIDNNSKNDWCMLKFKNLD